MKWQDVKNLVTEQIDGRNTHIDRIYKAYFMNADDRKIDLLREGETRRSNVRSPLMNMFTSRIVNMILKSEIAFVAEYKGTKSEESDEEVELGNLRAKEMLDLLDYCRTQAITQDAFEDIVNDAVLLGFGYGKVSYRYKKIKRKYTKRGNGAKDGEFEYVEDFPYLEYISPYNLFIDPFAKSIESARFIIERKLIPQNQIEGKYRSYGFKLAKEAVSKATSGYISDKDYDSVKRNLPFYVSDYGDDRKNINRDERFRLKKDTHIREVIEVHTPDDLCIYVNGVKHGPFKQIGPHQSYRYKVMTFKKNPGNIHGLGVGPLCMSLQEINDKVTNLRMDNVLLTTNKVFLQAGNQNIMGNSTTFKMSPGKIIKVNDLSEDSFKEMKISEVKESAYREPDTIFAYLQALFGLSSNVLGLQNKVERTAGGAETLSSAADDQLIPLQSSMMKFMASLAKDFILFSLAYADDNEVDASTGEIIKEGTLSRVIGEKNRLSDLDIEEVIRGYAFDFQMNSQRNKNEATEVTQLLQILQLSPQLVDQNGMLRVNIEKLIEQILGKMDITEDLFEEGEPTFGNGSAPGQQLPNTPGDVKQMRNIQQQGASGGGLGDFATNAQGINA